MLEVSTLTGQQIMEDLKSVYIYYIKKAIRVQGSTKFLNNCFWTIKSNFHN